MNLSQGLYICVTIQAYVYTCKMSILYYLLTDCEHCKTKMKRKRYHLTHVYRVENTKMYILIMGRKLLIKSKLISGHLISEQN